VPKAREVRKALEKLGWEEVRCKGSHHTLRRGQDNQTFSWHDSDELGTTQLRIVAKAFGVSVDDLR
jgi:predicted RNA binding protein YcfA (HicA-like mRNA interferase family)